MATGTISLLGVGGWVFSHEREPAHAQASIHSVPGTFKGMFASPASVFEGDGPGFSLLSPEYRRNVFFVYEKRLREHSPPEKVFEYFSSIKSDDGTFMTYMDLMRAAVPVFQPVGSKQIRSGSLGGENKDENDANRVSSNFFNMFDMDGDGLISFPEYLFFVTLLSLTDEQCKAIFNEFDVDKSGSLSRAEFLQMMKRMRLSTIKGKSASGYRTGMKTTAVVDDLSGGLVRHLFGDSRKNTNLTLKKFESFLTELRTEIDSLEFEHYDFKKKGSISVEDFGFSVVAGASVRRLQHFIDRASQLSKTEFGIKGRRITKAQYLAFCWLLKHGDSRFKNAIRKCVGEGGHLTRDTFLRLAKECGARLSETQIDVIYFVFDVDGDGELSPSEFLDVVSRF